MQKLFYLKSESTDKQILEIFQRYWKIDDEEKFKEKVPEIATEYKLNNYELRKRINKNCYCYSTIFKCPKCEEPKRYNSRSKLKRDKKIIKLIVPNWTEKDKDYIRLCMKQEDCASCKRKEIVRREVRKEELIKEKKELLKEYYQIDPEKKVGLEDLDLQDAIYLVALFREGADENLEKINPIQSFNNKLAPTKKLTISILNTLFYKKYISIHPDSELSAFRFVNDSIMDCDIFAVTWKPIFKLSKETITQEIIHWENRLASVEWKDEWWKQLEPLWKEIAYAEVLEFLISWMSRHNLIFKPREKTYKIITSLHSEFSTSNINYMIWSKMKDTTSFLVRENPPSFVATNYLMACVESFADKIKANNWIMPDFDRSYACQISVVADIFYHKVLKLDGFKSVPKI